MTNLSKNDIIKKVEELHDEAGLQKDGQKRIYRKRETWDDPDSPAYSEQNRIKKQFTMRATPQLLKKIEAAAKEAGISRQEWIEKACIDALTKG